MTNLLKRIFPVLDAPKDSEIDNLRHDMLALRDTQRHLAEQQGVETHQLNGLTAMIIAELTGNDQHTRKAFQNLMYECDLPINFRQAVREYSDPKHDFSATISPIMANITKAKAALQCAIDLKNTGITSEMGSNLA